jgi:SAM-dependent methyltransferase
LSRGVAVSKGRETGRSYDRVASDYASQIAGELTDKPFDRGLLDAFAELSGGGAVADVGCGPGHVGAYLAARGVHTVGLDLSPEMCAIASRTTPLRTCAADMTALPLRSRALTGLVCMYAVIHLDAAQRAAAYREFTRVLGAGAHALIAFHTSDAEHRTGETRRVSEWWGHDVDLTFHFLDAGEEVSELGRAGLELVARLDRSPHAGTEHQSQRSYLVVRRSTRA